VCSQDSCSNKACNTTLLTDGAKKRTPIVITDEKSIEDKRDSIIEATPKKEREEKRDLISGLKAGRIARRKEQDKKDAIK
jgi:hypothetical protein